MTAASQQTDDVDPRVSAADGVLLGGDGRPADPVEAAVLYARAMAEGSGAAAARLAVLAAMGVARPSNWIEAIDRLADAAELGWRPAQKQLAILAGRDDVTGRTGSPALWRTLRKEIDLGVLLKAPALRRTHVAPSIALLEGLATKAMCRWIIAREKAGSAEA